MPRLVLYNIQYCQGFSGNWLEYIKFWRVIFPPKKAEQQIMKNLKKLNPDIVGFTEIDTGSMRSGGKNKVKEFGKKLQMKGNASKKKYANEGLFNVLTQLPFLKNQANALMSKSQFSDIKYHQLGCGTKRLFIEATLKSPKVTIFLAHLSIRPHIRKKQLEEIIGIISLVENPIILMGDLNTMKGQKELKELLNRTKLNYLADNVKYTYPAFKPKKTFDYVLTSSEITVNRYEVLESDGSDHLPILVDFTLK